mmetsp:Transcript_8924/g.21790  ORF Transcript_8924/g.21790 Transcript_8924/m.21790 type:complete len:104 (-) Transcript_8924:352-663(-)|eukprot:CAMPEP_0172404112 /NCGR_PEP_ID=MMETSP1061-20121228/61872_1 /TAXON_ID=37318 /ORGANISM="Pseudo-nitzschia pungens, Strain cf. pungens" /LENGTH=103 /DNA_ID=CAMNT_0013138767 /DNA_START=65 /DNA_END=376 /DNA_ORIENTATION=+
MTADVAEKDTSPSKNKSFFKKGSKKEKSDKSDDCSISSTSEKNKNWLGQEMKRPRAEYQAEIDELKLKLVALETELLTTTSKLNAFKEWMRQAPTAYQESVEL